MFTELDGSWPRQEHYRHYMDNVRCTYSLTVQIDITRLYHRLKADKIKAYPAQIYMLATVVNLFEEFRMGLSNTGKPGYWDMMHPAYTVFHKETETFSSIYTLYDKDFSRFYRSCLDDMDCCRQGAALFPQKDTPANLFNISSLPWIEFTAFNLNVYTEGTHLAPVFTLGKYVAAADKIVLPLAMQLHHAACDGYHAGRFLEALRHMALNDQEWL